MDTKANMNNLNVALGYIATAFNMHKGFQVTKFQEKGNKLVVTLANEFFENTIIFKNKDIIEGLNVEE
ncbi:MAG: hypothetical protein H0Z24_05450 [Thermosipho sp. (in: Bacteria)]|nr:hypothetical protein [Thermosipho sp. (in: thermotogales)]